MTDLRRGLLAGTLAFVVVACSTSTPTASPSPAVSGPATIPTTAATNPGPTAPTTTPSPGKTPKTGKSTAPATPEPSATPEPTTEPSATPTEPTPGGSPIAGLDQLVGTDGRFTMLLLGSDARPGLGGERTDTIMIASIDPATGKVSFISLPRDTADVPIGPGQTYSPKVTGLFQQYHLNSGSRKSAYQSMVKALQYTFGIEIDRYALAHFDSVIRLIDAMGGIDVTLKRPFVDPTSHVTKRGLRLKAGVNHLDGHIALAFARSRHTTTDYDRARRQQLVISVAVAKVLSMGVDALPALTQLAFTNNTIETDVQAGDIPTLYALAQQARLANFKSVVLGPSQYASGGGPPTYATFMNVAAVRALFSRIFGH